ncbi:hypothetical protein [Spirillospora sp. CA-294931]|uniref:hypothetical protein n=1 Tax=Spirillospora sp. CA-294931 TaxID=3240042 RepID=UPI003D92DB70
MRTAIPGLGEIRGDHAVISPALGSTAQVLRAFMLLLWVVLIGAAVVDPGEFTGKALIMTAAVAAVYTAKLLELAEQAGYHRDVPHRLDSSGSAGPWRVTFGRWATPSVRTGPPRHTATSA